MKNVIKIVAALLLLTLVPGYLLREPLVELAYNHLTRDMFVTADNDSFDPGPVLGSDFPGLQAEFQGRPVTLIDEFAGPNGTVLVASRSLDWCPYCMRQMIQLEAQRSDFDRAGIGLVAITYDTPAQLQAFSHKHGITIPLLSDLNALSFKTLGILNTGIPQDDPHYGIPLPGTIIISRDGKVAGKLFLEAYSSRVSAAATLDYARQSLGLP